MRRNKRKKGKEEKERRGRRSEKIRRRKYEEEGNSIDKNNTRHTFFSFDTFRRRPLSATT